MTLSISIVGVSGRMGKKILERALLDPSLKVAGGSVSETSIHLHKDLGTLIGESSLGLCAQNTIASSDVIIDFSSPQAASFTLDHALKHNTPLVLGTTGLSSDVQNKIKDYSAKIPILSSPNFSIGIAASLHAAHLLAEKLKEFFTIEIIETHHVHKKDSPSGTAIALAKEVGLAPSSIQSIREGEVFGEHRVLFRSPTETLELKHEALSRDTFADGALLAAKMLKKCAPGFYTLKDLFT